MAHALVQDLNSHDDEEPDAANTEDDPVAPPASDEPRNSSPRRPIWGRSRAACRPNGSAKARCCASPAAALSTRQRLKCSGSFKRHGLGSRLVPYEAAGRWTIGSLDVSGAMMVALCYVGIAGTPAPALLLRRLRSPRPRPESWSGSGSRTIRSFVTKPSGRRLEPTNVSPGSGTASYGAFRSPAGRSGRHPSRRAW